MMQKPLALIIDDEPDIRELLVITLSRMDIDCLATENLRGAYVLLESHKFDICLTDMLLPDGNGLKLVAYIQENHPQLPVAVVTAHGDMESAIQSLKLGCFDFLSKPVDLEMLRTLVKNALKLRKNEATSFNNLIGKTAVINSVKTKINKLARSQAAVHISGESGTGKELIARMIHEQSACSGGKFVPVNCGAIPAELMESELFGHVKGSFTGAVVNKEGLFLTASGGTLFFDEVADLPLHMQVKLLRTIQEKTIRPVGSISELNINTRILSATNQDLASLVREGKFREDLFYRINVIEIRNPPLRDRHSDIPLLVKHILEKLFPTDKGINISVAAMEVLTRYHFPGNIRELENILERATTFCENGTVLADDLQLSERELIVNEPQPLDSYLGNVEKHTILEALEKTKWNKTAAAKLLGISFRALRYRLEKLGID